MWAKCRECGAVSSIGAMAAKFTCRKCGKLNLDAKETFLSEERQKIWAEAMQAASQLKAISTEIAARKAKLN